MNNPKKTYIHWGILLTGIMLISVFHLPVRAADLSQVIPPSAINVKDFGAIGDGVHDDTIAIQKAVNAFVKRYKKQGVRVSYRNSPRGGSIAYHAQSQVVFPPGTYRITRPIVFQSRYAILRGIGTATIVQSDPSKLMFYFDATWQTRINNLHFKGGHTQLNIYTRNMNSSLISIDNCTFINSSSYAIVSRSYATKSMNANNFTTSKMWAPYKVTWSGDMPTLTPNSSKNLHATYPSTLGVISNCRFVNCMKAVNFSSDCYVIRDCSVIANPQADGPMFYLVRRPHLYRIKGVLNPAPGKHPYWIKRGGILSVRDSEFLTKDNRGGSLLRVTQDSKRGQEKLTNMKLCVVVANTKIDSVHSRGNSIIWLRKGIQPNILSMTNVTGVSGKPVNAVGWEDKAALKQINNPKVFSTTSHWRGTKLENLYHIEYSGNSTNINTTLPKALQSFQQKPVPAAALHATKVKRLSWDFPDLQKQATTILYASKFSLDSNPKTDDTAVVQKIFNTAKQKDFCTVVFPGVVVKLSKTITIPPNVIVRGAGVVVFEGVNPNIVLFRASNADKVGFIDCMFNNGKIAVDVSTHNQTKARVAFARCWFSGQMIGVHCQAGQGNIGEKNHTQLLVDSSMMRPVQAVVTNAAHSQLSAFWAQNDPRLNEAAFIENRGGAMRVQNMLGVPILWHSQDVHKRGRWPADWKYSRNVRWIDNWGKLYCLDNRFGGEFKGMCNVFNRSAQGTVYIGGGISRSRNPASKKCILYLQKNPKVAVLRNISSLPLNFEGVNRIMQAAGATGKPNVYCSGVMTPWVK